MSGYVKDARSHWSVTQALPLNVPSYAPGVQVLDQSIDGVRRAVDELNEGRIMCPGGMCALYSASKKCWWLLFRIDQEDAAVALVAGKTGGPAKCRVPLRGETWSGTVMQSNTGASGQSSYPGRARFATMDGCTFTGEFSWPSLTGHGKYPKGGLSRIEGEITSDGQVTMMEVENIGQYPNLSIPTTYEGQIRDGLIKGTWHAGSCKGSFELGPPKLPQVGATWSGTVTQNVTGASGQNTYPGRAFFATMDNGKFTGEFSWPSLTEYGAYPEGGRSQTRGEITGDGQVTMTEFKNIGQYPYLTIPTTYTGWLGDRFIEGTWSSGKYNGAFKLAAPWEALDAAGLWHCAGKVQEASPPPKFWRKQAFGAEDWNQHVEAPADVKDVMQKLLDGTWLDIRTRDRKKSESVEKYEVVQVFQNENILLWNAYCKLRGRILEGCRRHNNYVWQEAKSDLVGKSCSEVQRFIDDMCLLKEANELLLFHGTKPAAARAICEKDFAVDLAGSNKGTLYGRGIYFGESSTKADEYAVDDGEGLFSMLVCKVSLGVCNYNTDKSPNPSILTESVVNGEYHSVLGDREKARGTFREFIVYDKDQAYPAYILFYRRVHG